MNAFWWILPALSAFNMPVNASECTCMSYPFDPNPPCFKFCVNESIESDGKNLSKIKNLPDSVRANLEILVERKKNNQLSDYNNIQSTEALKKAASSPTGSKYETFKRPGDARLEKFKDDGLIGPSKGSGLGAPSGSSGLSAPAH
ncbi:hypothetical protein [Pseudomonas entomophila]|uniref:hypothetical protein n=1 Tax=Pseudomonas entomophila TaxID=312306 RepID=UPI002010647F|nr:hypothetical protein [Pseudomonas entomophila]